MCVRWVDPGWLSDPHPVTLSLSFLTTREGENDMEMLVIWHEDRDITCQLLLRAVPSMQQPWPRLTEAALQTPCCQQLAADNLYTVHSFAQLPIMDPF